MRTFDIRIKLWCFVFLFIVLASRIPLLGHGYGSDADSWRNVVAALSFHARGYYVPSRLPGFPVFEGLLFLLVPLGWVITNLLSAIAGLIAVVIFYDLARRMSATSPFWITFAFAFSGPLWVHATQTMDYATGLAFLLGCYSALLRRRYIVGGALLALAAGCRASTGAVILPALVWLLVRRENGRAIASLLLSFGVTVSVLFAPPLLMYYHGQLEEQFLMHASRAHATPSMLPEAIRSSAVYLFSKLGSAVLVLGVVIRLIVEFRNRLFSPARAHEKQELPPDERAESAASRVEDTYARGAWVFELGVILVVGAFYLAIPYELAYLIPLLPFALLIAGRLVPRPLLAIAAMLVLSDSFITPLFGSHRLVPGRLFLEVGRRRADLARTARLADRSPGAPTVFVIGRFAEQRLLVLYPSLERTESAWAPFYESDVSLWAEGRRVGYAAYLDERDRVLYETNGYRIEDLSP